MLLKKKKKKVDQEEEITGLGQNFSYRGLAPFPYLSTVPQSPLITAGKRIRALSILADLLQGYKEIM